MKNYRWAVIGAGTIAREMSAALNKKGTGVYGIANRTKARAEILAREYGIHKVYDTIDDAMTDPDVDIIYVATTHNNHFEQIMKALDNGKHVLCEKAITVSHDEIAAARALADQKHLVLMEAMTLYHMPIYRKMREILDSGSLGPVKMVQVNFGSLKDYDPSNRFFNPDLAGGALLDIGIYALSFARFFMNGGPKDIATLSVDFETGVDEESGIVIRGKDGQMAVTALTMRAKQPKRGVVAAEGGYIEINDYPRADQASIFNPETGETKMFNAGEKADALVYEAADMEAAVEKGVEDPTLAMSDDVLGWISEIQRQWKAGR